VPTPGGGSHAGECRARAAATTGDADDPRRTGGQPPVRALDGAAAPQAYAHRLVAEAVAEVWVLVADRLGRLDVPAPVGSALCYRAVHRRAALSRPGEQGRLAVALAGGRDLRVVDRPPFNALIVDRKVALVPVGRETDAGPALILVHPGGLLDVLLAAFERSWTRGVPLVADGPAAVREDPAARVPNGADLYLLQLLAEGLTDEAIANKLDVSARTVQRRVRDLIDLSGVRSRLQLIWAATRRGWI
jgi:DNA-binding CsgD family transcriptional regulator